MSFRFKKTFNFGPFRTNVSKNGIGNSVGFLGVRVGVTAEGKKYWSFGIKGTGLYYIKYMNNSDINQ